MQAEPSRSGGAARPRGWGKRAFAQALGRQKIARFLAACTVRYAVPLLRGASRGAKKRQPAPASQPAARPPAADTRCPIAERERAPALAETSTATPHHRPRPRPRPPRALTQAQHRRNALGPAPAPAPAPASAPDRDRDRDRDRAPSAPVGGNT
ncbi:hypothetical protein GGI07_002762 [Coemansia sp. Benny D115]|nr:hypothetical protein GGI07_002762 [Coemansia sp. Benny D115]